MDKIFLLGGKGEGKFACDMPSMVMQAQSWDPSTFLQLPYQRNFRQVCAICTVLKAARLFSSTCFCYAFTTCQLVAQDAVTLPP